MFSLANRDKSQTVFQVMSRQWEKPSKNDWTEQVKGNLKDLNIVETELKEIMMMKKEKFKQIIRKKIMNFAFTEMMKKK